VHELIDSLEAAALPAIAVTGAALMIQQRFKIISKLVHGRIVDPTEPTINHI
jgi:hypothetical protein